MSQRRMMFARANRTLVVAAAILCFAAAGVLTPSDVRSQLALRQPATVIEPATQLVQPLAPVLPARDAFAPRAGDDDDPRPALPKMAPMSMRRPPPTSAVLPRTHPVSVTRVIAVATGSNPSAIVDNGGSERLVTIGDPLDGSEIVAIQDDVIQLADGRHLALEPAGRTP